MAVIHNLILTYIYVYTHAYTRTYTYTRACIHIHTYPQAYIHIRIYIDIRTHMYTCPILNIYNIFTSTLTNMKYHSINFDQNFEFLSCHSTNVIYLLTCNKCSIQYVGETVQPHMASRMTAHIRTANKDSTEEGCRYLREHFTTIDPYHGHVITGDLSIVENSAG